MSSASYEWLLRDWQTCALVPLRSYGVVDFKPGSRSVNSLLEHYVFLVVFSGRVIVKSPRGILEMKAGEMALIPPLWTFSRRTPKEWSCSMIEVQVSVISGIIGARVPLQHLDLPSVVKHSRPRQLKELVGRFRELVPKIGVDSPEMRLRINPILQELFSEYFLNGLSSGQVEIRNNEPEWLGKLRDEVGLAYKDPSLDMTWMEMKAGRSRSQITRAFREWMGQAPMDYLHRFRIHVAERVLRGNPQYKIEALAVRCGYRDRINFYRHFKRITGLSPNDYRSAEQT